MLKIIARPYLTYIQQGLILYHQKANKPLAQDNDSDYGEENEVNQLNNELKQESNNIQQETLSLNETYKTIVDKLEAAHITHSQDHLASRSCFNHFDLIKIMIFNAIEAFIYSYKVAPNSFELLGEYDKFVADVFSGRTHEGEMDLHAIMVEFFTSDCFTYNLQ